MDEQKHLSELLIEELKANGVINKSANLTAAQLIIRKFFIQVYQSGITDQKCAANSRGEYREPNFHDVKE